MPPRGYPIRRTIVDEEEHTPNDPMNDQVSILEFSSIFSDAIPSCITQVNRGVVAPPNMTTPALRSKEDHANHLRIMLQIFKDHQFYAKDEKKELVRDVYRLAHLGVRLVDSEGGGVFVQNGSGSSLMADVKENKYSDTALAKLKKVISKKAIEAFSQEGDSVLRYQVKVEHLKQRALSQDIDIPTWKWETLNMDFATGLPRTQRHLDSIWVIVD
ncbi:uncharacterized protein LOC129899792 [Solanum dulcamara]|uniref:uncharacterized protein LOC129899792 n=1 Tax=Solanum dulcamara TaxID=45834 RepID=UPI002484E8FE|nr:uncharacterized protein LOC129899792 [Solanum dulcamara]